MKKLLTIIILVFSLLIVVACSENEDRSFSIDEVAIDAQIDAEGLIHVRELYTYTFDGTFEGMTRSIDSDVNQFKAYGIDGQTADPTISVENLDPLTTEKDESTWKIYSSSKDETKQVLYSYKIEGSVKKYQDVADLTYSFFDESNETDLNQVKIAIHTPENMANEHTHYFLHGDAGGELTAQENQIIYTNDLLAAGDHSKIRLIFPAEELQDMQVSKDKRMEEKILAAELELIERSEHVEENMEKVVPVMWGLIVVVIILTVVLLMNHPDRYRGNKSVDEFSRLLEETDPLFVSYLNFNGYLQDHSIIAALFSLKQRGIVTMEEVISVKDQEETTFRFTWKKDRANVDPADGYLREWLFTENDESGPYFLLESITDQEDEADDVREKKAEAFGEHLDVWVRLVKDRETYQELKRPFRGFTLLSPILIMITFALFYYMTKVDAISQTEQLVLPLILAVLGVSCIIFNRQKWLIFLYYPFLLVAVLIPFTMTTGTILTLIFYIICFIALIIIPSTYWNEEIVKIKYAIKQSRKLMNSGEYPVGVHPNEMEKRLEYAMILGEGDQYVKQFEEMENISQLHFPLLSNPTYATQTFNTGNLMLLSLITINSTSTSTTVTTSSTGGGGAGAF